MTSYAELIHILSVICSIGFLAFFFSKKGHLCSLKNIFIFLWSYYVFCVPLDKALGIKMLTSSSLAFLDLNLPESLQTINYVTLLYVILLVGFLVGYSTVNVKCDERRSPFCKLLPSYITVLVINLLVFGLNFYVFGGETRTGKALLIRNDFLYKLIFAPTILVGALNAVYIYLSNNKKGVFWVFIAACIGIFLSGGRTVIVYYTLLLIYKYKFDMKVWVKILSVPLFFGFVFFWKGFYNNFLNFLRGDPLVPFLSESYVIGFSRFEGIMSYSMTATVIHESDFQTPLLLGMSYLQSLWLIFIRGSFLKPAETLAESYGSVIAPSVMSQGGGVAFSGVLEAWLNFGVLGPFIIGTLLGGVGKYFDNNRNSVLLPIVLLCFLRYFRSDFASMFKRLIVLNGSMIVVVVTVVYLYQVWYRKKHVG